MEFVCKVCEKRIGSYGGALQHLDKKHGGLYLAIVTRFFAGCYPWICRDCNHKVNSPAGAFMHLDAKHSADYINVILEHFTKE